MKTRPELQPVMSSIDVDFFVSICDEYKEAVSGRVPQSFI